MTVHVFGIRHHGPGSARSLARALEALQPDAVLIEGPPDADHALSLAAHAEMQPPVALLVYAPDSPNLATFYPFAAFSPEWQAMRYALARGVPAGFIDLPQAHQLALRLEAEQAPPPPDDDAQDLPPPDVEIRQDPLAWLAEAAGYSDGERWWEHMVEHRRSSADLFDAILEAMGALRAELPPSGDPVEAMREAYMRRIIRAAKRRRHKRIAVVCGAWHAPALVEEAWPRKRDDDALLKGLPKIKTAGTWVPWTHGRLARGSGYGAGIESPGWYHHLFTVEGTPQEIAVRWLTGVAHLLRAEDLDASSAQIIDAVRLAEALAALRDHPLPGLAELNEATQAVLCFGRALPMRLIQHKLIVGERLGAIPASTPMVPLARDLEAQQRSLRMKPNPEPRELKLDLRKPMHLGRSHLLHRLDLLDIPWGRRKRLAGDPRGTFWELWDLQWQPEFMVRVIESSGWGNTVFDAATAYARDAAGRAPNLPALTDLLSRAMLADLPGAAAHVMARVQDEAALSSDVGHLMDAVPPLADLLRHGSVRDTDAEMVAAVLDGLAVRVCIGLPGACASLDDDAAEAMFRRVSAVNEKLRMLQNPAHVGAWQSTLLGMLDQSGLHGLVAGRCARLLLDAGALPAGEAARRMGLALSRAADPPQAAAWVEGFLRGSGMILLHDDMLWDVIDGWVTTMPGETFTALLPLLRRTFSTFTGPERRRMGERARRARRERAPSAEGGADAEHIDAARADGVLPVLAQLLGVEVVEAEEGDA